MYNERFMLSSENITTVSAETFADRFQRLFKGMSVADIGRKLEVPHTTVRNYSLGRLPAPEILIKIANETNVSLNWLLTGDGPMIPSPSAAAVAPSEISEPAGQPGSGKEGQNTQPESEVMKRLGEVITQELRRLGEATGRTVEQVLADGEKHLQEFRKRTREGSRHLPESGSAQPLLNADRPNEEEPEQTMEEKLAMLIIMQMEQHREQHREMVELLKEVVKR
jgi:transcriptional regulator with XRE-family HTH domain